MSREIRNMKIFPYFCPHLFSLWVTVLVLMTGCTSVLPGFSGIYVWEDNPDGYLEFRGDGTVYSRIDGEFREVARWTRESEDQLCVCDKNTCQEMAIGKTTLYYYKNGVKRSLIRAERIPDPTPTPVQTATTPAYIQSSDVEQVGNVMGVSETGGSSLDYIQLSMSGVNDARPVEVSALRPSYSDGTTEWPQYEYVPGTSVSGGSVAHSARWGISEIRDSGNPQAGTALSPGRVVTLVIGMPASTTPDTRFELIITMPDESELRVTRTVPAAITKFNLLY